MLIRRWTLRTATLLVAAVCGTTRLSAQGVTTAAISGVISDAQGHPIEDAQVLVLNRATGATAGATTHADGRYYVQGLEVGGLYRVSVRHIGYAPASRDSLSILLGQDFRLDLQLSTAVTQIAAVTTTTTAFNREDVISPAHEGVANTITDSAIARMPTLHRNFTDFLALASDISTSGPGNSGGGQNNRFNAIQIDGAVGTDLFALGTTGQPGGQANAKQVPLGAVQEYQIVLAPYDVRQGNFTGALVNAVTKSGTNEVHGELIGNYRDQNLERDIPLLRNSPFKQDQYGFSVGGPIVIDRLHFFLSGEKQAESTPASGPYFGEPVGSSTPTVDSASMVKIINALQNQYGYTNVGGGQQVTNKNPLNNFFGRLDLSDLPLNSRAVFRYNYAAANLDVFSRSASAFELSNNGYNFADATNSELLQLFSNFSNGASNEFFTDYTTISDVRVVPINAPYVTIKNVPVAPLPGQTTATGTTSVVAGTDNSSQGNALNQWITEFSDNYTLPWGDHRFTIGTKDQFYRVRNLFSQNSYGNYTFDSIDSLVLGAPHNVTIGKKLDNSDGAARWSARTLGFYAEDQWATTEDLNLTLGLRVDVPAFLTSPGTNDTVLKYLHINTADMPKNNAQWAPRLGFNWDVTGDEMNQLRGGTGIFVGEPAYVWLSDAYGNSGVNGYANFSCSTPQTSPPFPGATGAVPTACAGSTVATLPPLTLNTVDPNLKFPAAWRTSIGFDRKLPWNVIGTLEGMYTRMVDQFYYQNISLPSTPIGQSYDGRDLYGNLSKGTVVPQYLAAFGAPVLNIGNETTNKDYAYELTAKLDKRFSDAFEGSLAYTHSRSYDQYDLTSSVANSNWAFGRDYSGLQSAQVLNPSKWDAPNRIVATGTYTFPTKTDLTLVFTGQSGVPFTYVYSGDANGDGGTSNDPIYVPRSASDTAQARFVTNGSVTVAQQQTALDNYINSQPCLNSQRGQIMARNSCRFPWTQELDISVRQSLRSLHAENLVLQIDVFNALNLLNKNWGAQEFASSSNDPALLTIKSWNGTNMIGGPGVGAMPNLNYNTSFNLWNTSNVSSNYRLQVQLKYTF
ncbi:MAG TPA: carboxypeptidase regulatory-like domain-containing protein [Gemmatimonadaceae bacterium]|nr:carboxypeptidase regulatory-like domain-containing protein [Gemmatimonadaceae bacterium]